MPPIGTTGPAAVEEDTRRCLLEAVGNLTKDEAVATPFYLRATAGARILEAYNNTFMTGLLEAVKSGSTGLPLLNEGMNNTGEILSGEDEGAFSWVAVNYLANTLQGATDAVATGGAL